MNNWGREREIEKPKRKMVYLVMLRDHPSRAFATELAAQNFRRGAITALREAYREAGAYFDEDNIKIYPMEIER